MKLTTLCYIEQDECYLMLHRTKKEKDENHDKWTGAFPDGCVVRCAIVPTR